MNALESLLGRLQPVALLLLRLYLGAFLFAGVWDNVTDAGRMAEFERFLAGFKCPWPEVAAPASVYVQLVCAALIAFGLLFRPAALLLALNFAVAFVLFAQAGSDMRAQYPHTILIFLGLLLATTGPGTVSLDALLARRRVVRGGTHG